MKYSLYLLLVLVVFSCSSPKARKPISNSSNSFFEESIKRSINTRNKEEKVFADIIKKDSLRAYITSPYGFWYHKKKKIDAISNYPKHGDEVVIQYEIRSIDDEIIYNKEELGTKGQANKADRLYIVDGENFIQGMQEGIKLMKVGETFVFLFPSNKAFGVSGFQNRIKPNQPLIIEVALKEIKSK